MTTGGRTQLAEFRSGSPRIISRQIRITTAALATQIFLYAFN
jgi:hypothetical protein